MMMTNLAMIASNSGIEIGLVIGLATLFITLALKASQDMQKAAREMGRLNAVIEALKEDIGELKESHKTVFQFLLNNSKAFRDSAPRQ